MSTFLRLFDELDIPTYAEENLEPALAHCEKTGKSVLESLQELDITLELPMAAHLVCMSIANWFGSGRRQITQMYFSVVLDEFRPEGPSNFVSIFYAALIALNTLADIYDESPESRATKLDDVEDSLLSPNKDIVSTYLNLSRLLASEDFDCDLCSRVCLAGANLLRFEEGRWRLELMRAAMNYARRSGSNRLLDDMAKALSQLCATMKPINGKQAVYQLDSIHHLVLTLTTEQLTSDRFERIFGPLLQSCPEPARFLVALIDPRSEREEWRNRNGIHCLTPLRSTLEPSVWQARLRTERLFWVDLEDARLSVESTSTEEFAETRWSSHAFVMPAFLRSIPLSQSFRSTSDFHQMLMVLRHEVIHSLCLGGPFGAPFAMLRSGFLATERFLQARRIQRPAIEAEKPYDGGPGFAVDHDMMNLFIAEGGIDCLAKLQALQTVWSHWLEGVAVFSELHAIPSDTSNWSNCTHILLGIVDWHQHQTETEDEFSSRVLAWGSDYEKAVLDAVESHGYFRLRAYLSSKHRKSYLAGYLLARRVVSSWRRSRGRDVPGELCSELLVAATSRYAHTAVPPLNLPLSDFRREVVKRFQDWIHSLSALTPAELDAYLSSKEEGGGFVYWKDKQLTIMRSATDAESLLASQVSQWEEQVFSMINGKAKELDGLDAESAPSMLAGMMIFEEVMPYSPGVLTHRFATSWRAMRILPLAEVIAPFWLNESSRSLAAFVRTAVTAEKTQSSLYAFLQTQLTDNEYHELLKEYNDTGEARGRVLRVVDLGDSRNGEKRVFGRHYIVFAYGSFLAIRTPHLSTDDDLSADLLEDIKHHLLDNEVNFDRRQVGENVAYPSMRTQSWIYDAKKWTIDGEKERDLSAWAKRVGERANWVTRAYFDEPGEDMLEQLLTPFFSDHGMATALAHKGLEAITGESPNDLKVVLQVLLRTGRSEGSDHGALAGLREASHLFSEMNGGVDVRPL